MAIHSPYDPKIEAERFVASCHLKEGDSVVLFGLGLNYHLGQILKRIGKKGRVLAVELNLDLLSYSLSLIDWQPLFKTPNLSFILSDDLSRVAEGLSSFLSRPRDREPRLIIHKPSLLALPPHLEPVFRSLVNIFTVRASGKKFAPLIRENISLNIEQIIKSPGIKRVFNKFLDKPVFIVSAGPSLDKELSNLCQVKETAGIFATGRALKTLIMSGIKPDLVIITDPQREVLNQIEGVCAPDVPLVFLPSTYPEAVRSYPGPKIVALVKDEFKAGELVEDKGEIETGGSVACAALDIAIKSGANPIIFVGQDLSYPAGSFYAASVVENLKTLEGLSKWTTLEMFHRQRMGEGKLVRIEGVGGKRVLTHQNMLVYLSWMMRKIAGENRRIFINASSGAKIAGTVEMDINEISSKFLESKVGPGLDLAPTTDPEKIRNYRKALERWLEDTPLAPTR
ncbi:DUF115 domain-containing protein [bacterium]|nr:DUF115 domain-containing protein [bacterium]